MIESELNELMKNEIEANSQSTENIDENNNNNNNSQQICLLKRELDQIEQEIKNADNQCKFF